MRYLGRWPNSTWSMGSLSQTRGRGLWHQRPGIKSQERLYGSLTKGQVSSLLLRQWFFIMACSHLTSLYRSGNFSDSSKHSREDFDFFFDFLIFFFFGTEPAGIA